ncbi:MAG: NAD(P)/FAD-dependent oxidoreductase [Acidobacteriaceae bacterium]|nr:NAD(P)/FAD-dependent oxidoreductase [Acidobacteriaceae bacterium]MBV8573163.1 NAD(P)/FAD-dependent oxidoreductase [Acidobacteriaceae bacterium]
MAEGSSEAVDVLVVGAGFSGLCMGIKLRKAGIESFLIIEKASDVGGTWWENRYPGCACDIPSHLYSFSFDRNPDWTEMFASQPEIQAYLKRCADKSGILPKIRFHTKMREAVWNEERQRWIVSTSTERTIEARVLVSGMGALHVPRYPEIPGIERFAGPKFHSAKWDRGVQLIGKHIAVLGTGASAVQFVPEIAPRAKKVFVYQRTPAWIIPRVGGPIVEPFRQWFRRAPCLSWGFRMFLFWMLEMRVAGFLGNLKMRERGKKLALEHLERQIPDLSLRAKLTPNYEFGCKRVLLSNDFYPTLMRPNVELVAEDIREIREHSLVTATGVERPADVLIFGTGFRATELLKGTRIVGRFGVELQQAWHERVNAYLGVTVSGFPNFFMLLGPNTGLGHNSVVLMIEAQVKYVIKCLALMRRKGQNVMDVRAETQQHFLEMLRKKLAGTVWETGGCRSWYQDPRTGETPAIWPGSVVSYRRQMRRVSAADYKFSS